MSIINKIKELINNLKPRLKNAHCVYFEGQTGLCQAKEFEKCNPINCELYTIDELSTILDLQDKLQAKEQECEELKKDCPKRCKSDKYKQALDKIEEFCIVYSNNHDAYETVYKHILDIINKAEEQ